MQHEYLKINKLLLVKILQVGAKVGKIAKKKKKIKMSKIWNF